MKIGLTEQNHHDDDRHIICFTVVYNNKNIRVEWRVQGGGDCGGGRPTIGLNIFNKSPSPV